MTMGLKATLTAWEITITDSSTVGLNFPVNPVNGQFFVKKLEPLQHWQLWKAALYQFDGKLWLVTPYEGLLHKNDTVLCSFYNKLAAPAGLTVDIPPGWAIS